MNQSPTKPSLSHLSKAPIDIEMDKISLKSCRVLIVTPSSESAMHVSGGVGKVILLQNKMNIVKCSSKLCISV